MSSLFQMLKDTRDFRSAESTLAAAKGRARLAVELEPNFHFVDGVFVRLTLAGYVEDEVRALSLTGLLGLSTCPRLAGYHVWSSGEAVLVTTIRGCERGPLKELPAGALSSALLEPLDRDFARLADAGYLHPWVSRGFAHWHLANDETGIVLSGWTALRAARGDEIAEARTDLDRLILSRRS